MAHGLLPHNGLILLANYRHLDIEIRSVTRDVSRGRLVKLRRGAYVEADEWMALDGRHRHLLRLKAVAAESRGDVIAAGYSAAALWGMPIMGDWPTEVTLLDRWKGGGRSDPGVRRTSRGASTARLDHIDGIGVTTLARTALDIARITPFSHAVGSVDWALWRGNARAITKLDLMAELELADFRVGARQARGVAGFATHLSDSMGESEGRAVMYELGFEIPELQVEFRDDQGILRPDYLWVSVRKFGEFDGKLKYTRNDMTGGNPGEVVWQEKKREDRLRRHDLGSVRILTEHVKQPRKLERLLIEAGIPRHGGR